MADGGPHRTMGADRSARLGAIWTRFGVRALVVATAGTMAAGFVDWIAGALVAVLTACTYVLLITVGPRAAAPYGRGRLLRRLQHQGYHLIPCTMSRHLAIGPSGAYLLETRMWQHAISRGRRDWLIGDWPASRVITQLVTQATRLERILASVARERPLPVIPVVMVAGRLPEPVMRADRAVIARPNEAVRYILSRPVVLEPEDIDAFITEVEDQLE